MQVGIIYEWSIMLTEYNASRHQANRGSPQTDNEGMGVMNYSQERTGKGGGGKGKTGERLVIRDEGHGGRGVKNNWSQGRFG